MLEIEMKFPVTDFTSIGARLRDWQATGDPPREDRDRYYNAPDRDFAVTDEALRIRSIGDKNFITYKGPKRDAQTKTRTEVEVPLADGPEVANAFGRILTHLGYRPVAVVRKGRRVFHVRRQAFAVEVCLDQVEELGCFVEVEILAAEDQLEAARNVLVEIAKQLGLEKSERRSYLELLLSGRGSGFPSCQATQSGPES